MASIYRFILVFALLAGCSGSRHPYSTTGGALQLSKVVLYRNGVGYFERGGRVAGDKLTIRVRKDQVNDLLKSLTVVEKSGGRAVSISMPLDPRAWANAANATLGPGAGSLAEVLDKLRGTEVVLRTSDGTIEGRILLVEVIQQEPGKDDKQSNERDFKVTLIRNSKMSVVRLSKVHGITLRNGDIALQFQRSLDATAGEGMFQQVEVNIQLAGRHAHDLVVSYVVGAPMWKPTYRIVLPEKGKGDALLQGWAVVDNTTGEDWRNIKLALTSGSPIAFRYDLHTPRDVTRADLSSIGSNRRANVVVGEAGYGQPAPDAAPPPPVTVDTREPPKDTWGGGKQDAKKAEPAKNKPVSPPKRPAPAQTTPSRTGVADKKTYDYDAGGEVADEVSAVDAVALSTSMQANTKSSMISGLTRYDLAESLTVPDGTSTMVAIINQKVQGEETFLFKPGGAGSGYEANPYRVIRFKNSTPFALESGPISIYSGGSFVGEGISEPVSANVSVTIPFAVESGLLVASNAAYRGDEIRLVKIVRGVIEIEQFGRRTTTWEIKPQIARNEEITVFVRHPKAGGTYTLLPRPPNTEDLPDAYLIPIKLAAKSLLAKLDVVEQTPSRTTLSIWDSRALVLFEGILAQGSLDKAIRDKLAPIVKLRQEVGRIDTEIEGKTRTRRELDQRANETRQSLAAIAKDTSGAANDLRRKLTQRLEGFGKDGDKLGRDLVELQTKRTEKKVALEDVMQGLDISPKEPLAPKP